MMKKISVVLCAGLFAVAVGAGCKKDSASAGDCDAVGKKVAADAKSKMPSGDMPAEAKKQMEEMTTKMVGLVVTSCKEDKWSKEAIDCGLKSKDPESECNDKLSDDQKKKMQERMMKAMGDMDMPAMPTEGDKPTEPAAGGEGAAAGGEGAAAAGTAAAGGAAAAGGSGLPECDEYVAAMDKYMSCDKVPQSARDAAKQGLDAMKSGWANMGQMPDDAKKAAGDACKQAIDALKQGASAMGCTL
jgi:hypothetical protein